MQGMVLNLYFSIDRPAWETVVLSEDTLQYTLYPSFQYAERASVTALAALILEYVDTLLPDHLWHRDTFQLRAVENEADQGYILEGHMRIGDCIDDEWCVVWLLREISSKWDIAIRSVSSCLLTIYS